MNHFNKIIHNAKVERMNLNIFLFDFEMSGGNPIFFSFRIYILCCTFTEEIKLSNNNASKLNSHDLYHSAMHFLYIFHKSTVAKDIFFFEIFIIRVYKRVAFVTR